MRHFFRLFIPRTVIVKSWIPVTSSLPTVAQPARRQAGRLYRLFSPAVSRRSSKTLLGTCLPSREPTPRQAGATGFPWSATRSDINFFKIKFNRLLQQVIISLLISSYLSGQVVFSKLPKNLQMFPRDVANYGHFEVEGISTIPCSLRTVLSEILSGKTIETFSQSVSAGQTFRVSHKVPACLKEYKLEVFAADTLPERLVALISGLVAGDFYIVGGQSNAECPFPENERRHDSTFRHPCNRVIGANFSWALGLSPDSTRTNYSIEEDCRFARPTSFYSANEVFGYSGVWPIKLQCELAQQTGIPNCLINGAIGGSAIFEHFASHTPSLPDSLRHSGGPKNKPPALVYDRMFKKLHANNATAGVKGIFWYQGETDGTYTRDSSNNYNKRFRTLYNSWKADYPSLQKIFVLQINNGCGGEFHSLIREIQRKFPEEYSDVVVMSTVGSPFSDRTPDLCHYTVGGYSRIAAKLLPLVKKYIYGFPLQETFILPANIQKAYYKAADQICLEFDKNIRIQDSCVYPRPDTGTAYLKDYFFRETDVQIRLISVKSEKNTVFLQLAPSEAPVFKITYLPQMFTNIPSLYSGPWILNEDNDQLGAYSFFEFPVQQHEPVKPEPVKVEEQTEEVLIYPNPAKKHLEIKFREEAWRQILVFDFYGKLFLDVASSSTKTILDVGSLSAGIYILTVNTSGGPVTSKIVIE